MVRGCLAGDDSAWVRLQKDYREPLAALLTAKGASATETEDLLCELWADLLGNLPDKPPLLERYRRSGPLKSWLATVAINRLVSLRRKTNRFVNLEAANISESIEFSVNENQEGDLIATMRSSLFRAWMKCEPAARVMMHLIYIEGIKQCEIASVWGWHESKISRALDAAMEQIREETLRGITDYDTDAILTWQDFVELGNHYDELFDNQFDANQEFDQPSRLAHG